jgi:hypothetical protein
MASVCAAARPKANVWFAMPRMVIGAPPTMISSVRLDGTTACMTIEGATNAEIPQAYIIY